MRPTRIVSVCLLCFLSSLVALAADLKVCVTDPQSAAVSGARVALYGADSRTIAVANTGADGIASFSNIPVGSKQVQVLAPGFRETTTAAISEVMIVRLQIATASDSVVVTATATPMSADETGSSVSSLDSRQFELLNQNDLSEDMRFTPGVYVSSAGQRGAITSLFVRGGDSTYNKVIVDGVVVNDAGGTFNAGVVPVGQVERLEVMRGADSTLYGSDAMTSVVQLWSAQGRTRVPEFRFGADGGTFETANGFTSVAGASGRFDYNVYANEFHSNGQGINAGYFNSLQGTNLGVKLNDSASLRFRLRHSNSRTGIPGGWAYPTETFAPNPDQYARQNDTLASLDLNVVLSSNWQNQFRAFEYNHAVLNLDPNDFDSREHFNRAGFEYHSEVSEARWTRSIFGYRLEDENGFGDGVIYYTTHMHGLRRNQAFYGEQLVTWKRLSLVAGARLERNESFGKHGIPRASITYLLLRGSQFFSGTRLKGSYAEGFKAPTFEQSFGVAGTYVTIPNPDLKPERNRSLEAGITQSLVGGKYSLSATYFNNLFHNQIKYTTVIVSGNYDAEYVNLNKSMAHGAEVAANARISTALSVTASYTYTSTQALVTPACVVSVYGCTSAGQPLLLRPKHFGQLLATYSTTRWGASIGGSFVGRRPDTDYGVLAIPIAEDPGYARIDISGWKAISKHVTAYTSLNNALNNHYQEVVGYPALRANFRAGMRFRFGGE